MGGLISSSQISKFPLTKDGLYIQKQMRQKISTATQASESSYKVACCLFTAFLAIVGLGRKDWLLRDTMMSFRGFLLVEVNCSLDHVNMIFSAASKMLAALGSEHEHIRLLRTEEHNTLCRDTYLNKSRNALLIEYYSGWPVTSLDKKVAYADLREFYRVQGVDEVRRYHKALCEYGKTFNHSTYAAKSPIIVKVVNVLCLLLPDKESFRLLQEPAMVSQIFEAVFSLMAAEHEGSRPTRVANRLFEKEWRVIRHEIYAFFITKGLIAKPAYELPKGRARDPVDKSMTPDHELKAVGTFGVLTPVPLHITDEAAAKHLYEQILDDIELLKEACEEARAEILRAFRLRLELAEMGRVCGRSDSVEDRKKVENRCRTWQEYNYHVRDRAGRYNLYAEHRGLDPELALLSPSTLLPFLYLLVAEHPSISGSWLSKLVLFDKSGKATGLVMDGKIADSIKPRRGPRSAQQPVYLTQKAKTLLQEMIMLTEQARTYLKDVGSDDYRYLILTSVGISEPIRKTSDVQPLSNAVFQNSILRRIVLEKLEGREDKDEFFKRITLKAMRVSSALKIYFETGRIRSMSEALGHKTLRLDLLNKYLPPQLMRFFLNRWIRIFQTAITYKAVVGRPCMSEAIGIHDEVELKEFLKHHDLKPLPPYLMVGKYGLPEINVTKTRDHAQVVFPVTSDTCQVILSMLRAAEVIKAEGGALSELGELWWRTGKYLDIATALQESGEVHLYSNEVVNIFRSARFSESIVDVLIPVLKAA
ncbi:hypothetical protein [Pseudomonas putida]|uniref:hypothetical protein n=1 Tax=Pseudomonas putida TaxID=303 RepID=UPI001575EC98|nr:hypothetical protein [Pseudomonas putida]NTY90441.1 hypothetical protein [Pseudomonas putida]NTY98983.1 hypothetical protein [Pseudomonas putida]NTZ21266.1 hypothetical protein [Pseudomonas putida]NTZ53215.1 hypothetical protein [Pseudomonas putida]NTZ65135.1 hypothetical protein [Pseudomonas putida]